MRLTKWICSYTGEIWLQGPALHLTWSFMFDLWKLRFTCAFIITTWSHSDELRELSAAPPNFWLYVMTKKWFLFLFCNKAQLQCSVILHVFRLRKCGCMRSKWSIPLNINYLYLILYILAKGILRHFILGKFVTFWLDNGHWFNRLQSKHLNDLKTRNQCNIYILSRLSPQMMCHRAFL